MAFEESTQNPDVEADERKGNPEQASPPLTSAQVAVAEATHKATEAAARAEQSASRADTPPEAAAQAPVAPPDGNTTQFSGTPDEVAAQLDEWNKDREAKKQAAVANEGRAAAVSSKAQAEMQIQALEDELAKEAASLGVNSRAANRTIDSKASSWPVDNSASDEQTDKLEEANWIHPDECWADDFVLSDYISAPFATFWHLAGDGNIYDSNRRDNIWNLEYFHVKTVHDIKLYATGSGANDTGGSGEIAMWARDGMNARAQKSMYMLAMAEPAIWDGALGAPFTATIPATNLQNMYAVGHGSAMLKAHKHDAQIQSVSQDVNIYAIAGDIYNIAQNERHLIDTGDLFIDNDRGATGTVNVQLVAAGGSTPYTPYAALTFTHGWLVDVTGFSG